MERRLRLRDGADFRRVRQEGRRYAGAHLRLHVAQGRCSHNRYGMVTGRQVGNAVQRNRIRRLLREALRMLHPGLAPGHDLVVVSRAGLAAESLAGVMRELRRQCRRAGLLAEGELRT